MTGVVVNVLKDLFQPKALYDSIRDEVLHCVKNVVMLLWGVR